MTGQTTKHCKRLNNQAQQQAEQQNSVKVNQSQKQAEQQNSVTG